MRKGGGKGATDRGGRIVCSTKEHRQECLCYERLRENFAARRGGRAEQARPYTPPRVSHKCRFCST